MSSAFLFSKSSSRALIGSGVALLARSSPDRSNLLHHIGNAFLERVADYLVFNHVCWSYAGPGGAISATGAKGSLVILIGIRVSAAGGDPRAEFFD